MMNIIIGSDVPEDCGQCNFTVCKGRPYPWSYYCAVDLKDVDFDTLRKDCPLISSEHFIDLLYNEVAKAEKNGSGHCFIEGMKEITEIAKQYLQTN